MRKGKAQSYRHVSHLYELYYRESSLIQHNGFEMYLAVSGFGQKLNSLNVNVDGNGLPIANCKCLAVTRHYVLACCVWCLGIGGIPGRRAGRGVNEGTEGFLQ